MFNHTILASCILAADNVGSTTPKLHELDLIKSETLTVTVLKTVASKWERVATRLYFDSHDIERIKKDNRECMDACRSVFSEWLEGNGRRPTIWQTLIEVLKEADFSEIASDLEDVLKLNISTQ